MVVRKYSAVFFYIWLILHVRSFHYCGAILNYIFLFFLTIIMILLYYLTMINKIKTWNILKLKIEISWLKQYKNETSLVNLAISRKRTVTLTQNFACLSKRSELSNFWRCTNKCRGTTTRKLVINIFTASNTTEILKRADQLESKLRTRIKVKWTWMWQKNEVP